MGNPVITPRHFCHFINPSPLPAVTVEVVVLMTTSWRMNSSLVCYNPGLHSF